MLFYKSLGKNFDNLSMQLHTFLACETLNSLPRMPSSIFERFFDYFENKLVGLKENMGEGFGPCMYVGVMLCMLRMFNHYLNYHYISTRGCSHG
jgi:hypothetical protein